MAEALGAAVFFMFLFFGLMVSMIVLWIWVVRHRSQRSSRLVLQDWNEAALVARGWAGRPDGAIVYLAVGKPGGFRRPVEHPEILLSGRDHQRSRCRVRGIPKVA